MKLHHIKQVFCAGYSSFSHYSAGAPFTDSAATTGTTDPSGLPDLISYVSGGRQVTLGVSYRM